MYYLSVDETTTTSESCNSRICVSPTTIATAVSAMWRSSLASSSKKLLYSSESTSTSGVSCRLLCHSQFYSTASPSPSATSPSPSDSLKLGLGLGSGVSNGARSFASASSSAVSFDLSSLAYLKARDAVDFARHYGRCYWELSKARLSMLVVATSGTGYILGSGTAIDAAGLCWTCCGTMMVAAAANSLNQVFEISNDAKMKRTMHRPLPSGRMTAPHAVAWASFVGVGGTAILAYKANMLASGLAASNLILYAFVYTPLKQIHPVNTWVGAVVGAIPPLLGWVAASGEITLNSMILPAALYFWQIPHFMALAYLCRDDYAAGGYKMLSLGDASGRRTALAALRNCMYLVPLGFFAYDWGLASGWFCLESSVLTLAISATAYSFYKDRTMQKARKMFYASLLYLPVFMTGILLHRQQQNLAAEENKSEGLVSSSAEVSEEESQRKRRRKLESRPPVAYASYAPFPFLPAPSYAAPSQ